LRNLLIVLSLAVCGLCLMADTASARQINFQVSVREKMPGDSSTFALIEQKNYQVTEGIKNTNFIVNFTLDLTAEYNDSGFFACTLSVFTLGPQAQTFFKSFRSEPGGVYFIEGVKGKEDVEYRIGISPLSVDSTAETGEPCDYDFRKDGVWRFDPAAHFDLYFVPKSLADARWNLLRDFLEHNYKDFKELFQLSFPGKINYFLSPCILPQVTWDQRMGFAIDPPRSNCFALYSHTHNTIDPIPAYLVRIYRFMGYAPPLLAEGMAGYFDFPHYYAQKLLREDQLPPLKILLKSIDYYSLPGNQNFSAASSFVKYLIDTYGFGEFKHLYDASSDLTIADKFSEVYNKSLPELESDWHNLLDTLTFATGKIKYFYERDQFIDREYGMDEFLNDMATRMDNFDDSVYVYSQMGWNLYMRGDYDTSRTVFQKLLKLKPNSPSEQMAFGNLLLLDGRYDSARVIFNRVFKTDTTIKAALYKIGESYYWQHKIDSATIYLLRDYDTDPSQLTIASSGILLGELSLQKGDTAAAKAYYSRAVQKMDEIYQYGKTWPSYLLRIGQAHLGLAMCGDTGELESARSILESALYFEVYPTRVIFLTRILAALGQIKDLEGDHDGAVSYYQKALSYPLAPENEARMRKYIKKPFAGYGS
jgi:tetratricopeptide (TPR) repeat protein